MSSAKRSLLPRATGFAHQLLEQNLRPGDHAIDATCGNGHDTAFLCRLVGERGAVIALDLQDAAIAATRAKLASEGLEACLLQGCHSELPSLISPYLPDNGKVEAIMFNLGYLPKGDKSVITEAGTTIRALDQACSLLADFGLLTIAVYTGHDGGVAEGEAVDLWSRGLPQDHFSVISYCFENQRNSPPHLIAVQKKPASA